MYHAHAIAAPGIHPVVPRAIPEVSSVTCQMLKWPTRARDETCSPEHKYTQSPCSHCGFQRV